MSGIKGAPPTFDLEKLTERLKRVAAGENCGWPTKGIIFCWMSPDGEN